MKYYVKNNIFFLNLNNYLNYYIILNRHIAHRTERLVIISNKFFKSFEKQRNFFLPWFFMISLRENGLFWTKKKYKDSKRSEINKWPQ